MAMTSNPTDRNDPAAEQLAVYHAKLRDDPDDGAVWLEYGDFVDEEYELPDEVVRAYENAAKLLPKRDLRLRLGSAYVNAGKSDVGIALIRDSVADNPRAHGFCFLADAYLQLGDYESARSASKRAIAEDPSFEEGYYLLGEATRHFSQEEAIGYFRAAIKKDESYALAWQALGKELAANNDTLCEAILALRKAIELNPEDGWAMVFLANALWRMDRTDEAENWYQRAVSVFPDCDDVKRSYAQFRSEVETT